MNAKGFFISPFILVMLILMTAAIYLHHSEVKSEKNQRIMLEGRITKNLLEVDETRLSMNTAALFAAYQAAYETGRESGNKTCLEEKIEGYLNNHLADTGAAEGNHTIRVTSLDSGGFILRNVEKPVTERNMSGFRVEADLGVERYVDARFFLLYNLSTAFNYSLLAERFTENLVDELGKEFNFTLSKRSRNGGVVCLEGDVDDCINLGRGGFIAVNITGHAIYDTVDNGWMYFPGIFGRNCSLLITPRLITAHGSRSDTGEIIWQLNVSLAAVLLDQAGLEGRGRDFVVATRRPILLLNGSMTPLTYVLGGGSVDFFYSLSLGCDGFSYAGAVKDYTRQDFMGGVHLPRYFYVVEADEKWVM